MGKKIVIFVFIIIVLALLIIGGIMIYNDMFLEDNDDNNRINNTLVFDNQFEQNTINSNIELMETVRQEEKVSPGCIFVFKTYYPQCDHIKIEKEQAKDTMVNKNKEDLSKIYKDWSIVTFRNNNVLFYKEEEGICNEHYLIKELDGYIAIYNIDEDDDVTLKDKTTIVTTYLAEEDLQRLREGIRVNGKEELNRTLEDYE